MQTIPPAPAPAAPASIAAPATSPQGFLPLKYIGKREFYTEGAYGTKLQFRRGQTRMVPRTAAVQMLRHPDVYVLGKAEDVDGAMPMPAAVTETSLRNKESGEEQESHEQAHHSLLSMNRKAMANFAKVNFGQDLDPEAEDVATMRARVKRMLDQFGLPGSTQK